MNAPLSSTLLCYKHAMTFRFLSALLSLILFVGCTANTATDSSFFAATSSLPGVRVSLAKDAPQGYTETTLSKVYFFRQQGNDIWLHAPEERLQQVDQDNSFRSWLHAARSLRFHTSQGDVYWIPADRHSDPLTWVTKQNLTPWLNQEQLAELWVQRGEAYRNAQAFREAINAYTQALDIKPDLIPARLGMGASLLAIGQKEEALAHLSFVVNREPHNYWAQRLLGNAYLNLYRYTLAVGPLTRAYLIRPDIPDPLIGIALGLGRSGERALALKVLEKVEKSITDPGQMTAIQQLRKEFTTPKD